MERSARAALVPILTFLLLSSVLAPPAGAAASVSLDASTGVIVAGGAVRLSGALTDDAACLRGRDVTLSWHPAGDPTTTIVDTTTTASDGTFSFSDRPSSTGRYSADVAPTGSCGSASSPDSAVRVRALVELSLASGALVAGSCAKVEASVTPAKPSETVELQRRAGGAWTTIDTLTLDDASQATARPCFVWSDIGVVRLRARWPAQDALNETNASPALELPISEAPWMEQIDDLVGGRAMSVSVGDRGAAMYEHAPRHGRTPASNEKLLLSMTLLDTFGTGHEIITDAAAKHAPDHGVLRGDLWIRGRGDPEVDRSMIAALARRLHAEGVERIRGRVIGSTGYFRRDWSAPGWNHVARQYVNRPTALTFDGNDATHPELEAARALTDRLERLGVRVSGSPSAGAAPGGLTRIGSVRSRPLHAILRSMLRPSDNFDAEVLGKGLGAEVSGPPGTIAKGAAAIARWVADQGASSFRSYDSSGLSYWDRVTTVGIVHLLGVAEDESWGSVLRSSLPTGGQGTLEHRLRGVPVRAKTGTLDRISALSGWVRARRLSAWIEFSIVSAHLSKNTASSIEDHIVRILHRSAH